MRMMEYGTAYGIDMVLQFRLLYFWATRYHLGKEGHRPFHFLFVVCIGVDVEPQDQLGGMYMGHVLTKK
jgi:hypothetical protein